MVTIILPFGFPLWSFPPNIFLIVPLFIVTSMSPSTYGIWVLSPCPPPKTFVIIPLFIVTIVFDDDMSFDDVSPFTVPNALPPYTEPFMIGVVFIVDSPTLIFMLSLTNVPLEFSSVYPPRPPP